MIGRLDPRLWKEAHGHGGLLAAQIAGGLLGAAASIARAWFLAGIIDAVFLKGSRLGDVSTELAAVGAGTLFRCGGVWATRAAGAALAARVKQQLRGRYLTQLQRLGPVGRGGEGTAAAVQIAVDGVEALDAYFSRFVPQLLLAALIPVLVLGTVMPLDPLSGAVLLVTAPLIPLFLWLIGLQTERASQRRWRTLSRLGARFLDLLQGLETLRLLGAGRRQSLRIAEDAERYRRATLQVLRIAFLSALTLELVAMLGTALVAVEVGLRLLYARLAFAQALFVLILVPEFYAPLRQLGAHFHAAAPALAAADRIYAVLHRPAPVRSGRRAPGAPRRIVFDNVAYAYPPGRTALQGVDLVLERGRILAVVGPSGAGKTTLGRLLLRFMDPMEGRILVDGAPLSEVDPERWRDLTAWVPARPHWFQGTMADNLRLGRPRASRSEMEQALRQARLEDVVAGLPRGLDTVLGERGSRLSGGEAQRLAIARALLRDAAVVVLDEPTAHLDAGTEERIRQALDALTADRIVLMVGHRLTTVARAHRLAVLDRGRVVECGAPAELLHRAGSRFARMHAMYRRRTAGDPP